MADAVVVDSWDGQRVRLSQVTGALAELRNRTAERSTTRTAVMTLVVVVPDDDAASAATAAIHALGGHHPARILVLQPHPDQVAVLDACAALYSTSGGVPTAPTSGSDGPSSTTHPVNFEEISLLVGGQAALHLDSLVDTFTLADLPVTVWYPNAVPVAADPLLSVADAVIVDTEAGPGTEDLLGLLQLSRRRAVVDLSWVRLAPWRELLAGLFDGPDARRYLGGVAGAQVRGSKGARTLLSGWLAAQLRLRPDQIRSEPGPTPAVTLTCATDGETATFDVAKVSGRPAIWAAATLAGDPSGRQVLGLADDPLASSLGDALTHLRVDAVWQRALSAAASLSV
ncbi:MAG: glucose-6-phosphate dehydrogenase assembly protein OpcA [Actinomycetota bacterium]|nr:glucose-6-phosphate dehydrogenase assembly protein OpcA [Actinomycetota bacterium]